MQLDASQVNTSEPPSTDPSCHHPKRTAVDDSCETGPMQMRGPRHGEPLCTPGRRLKRAACVAALIKTLSNYYYSYYKVLLVCC